MNNRLLLTISFILFFYINNISAQNCTVNAGVDSTICETETLTLNGVLGGQISSSLWVQTAGPSVIIQNPSTPVTDVIGIVGGNTYTFKLTAVCADTIDANSQSITITVNPIPIADAGQDIDGCPGTYNLSANSFDPSLKDVIGYWMILGSNQAGVTIADNSSPTSSITLSDTSVGSTTLRWTIENNNTSCITEDELVVTNFGGEPIAIAGNDKTLSNCYTTTTSTQLNASIGGDGTGSQIGVWSFVSGPNVPNIVDVNDQNTRVNGLIEGTYVFRWTVTGPCASGKDEVTITVPPATQDITDAVVNRRNIRFCDPTITTAVLKGNVPQFAGETVLWTQVGGPSLPSGSIVSPNSPTTQVINLDGSSPKTYSFRYTIIGGSTNSNCTSRSETKIHFNEPSVTIEVNSGSDMILNLDQTVVNVPYTITGGNRTRYEIISAPDPSGLVSLRNAGQSPLRLDLNAGAGVYTLRMVRDSQGQVLSGCNLASDEINITVSLSPTQANAGSDSVLDCGQTSTSLAGNPPSVGVATWSQVSGPSTAIISDINIPNPTVTNLIPGEYIFRYLIYAGPNSTVSSSDTKVTYATPPVANAGPDESICAGTYQLQGNALSPGQSGVWTVSPNTGVSFLDDTLYNTSVSGLQKNQSYTFTWTISTIKCGDDADDVLIDTKVIEAPSRADAGADICLNTGTSSLTLTAIETETPFRGSGEWTFVSGPTTPVITSTGDFTAEVTNITSDGDYEFKWTVDALFCSATTEDNIIVSIASDTSLNIDAGPDQTICGTQIVMSANTPASGLTGKWEQVSGNAGWSVDDITSPNAVFTNLYDGNYVFQWIVSKGTCESSSDDVAVSINGAPTPASAGPIADICNGSSLILTGNVIVDGTGTWTVVSGPNNPTIVDVNNPTSEVTNLVTGLYEFKWTSRKGFNCPNSEATTTAQVVAQINLDGKDQDLCAASQVLLEANPGSIGVWTQTAPINTAVISLTTTSDNTAIAELDPLLTDTYIFTFTAGTTCTSSDSLEIKNTKLPDTPFAGADQQICTDTSTSVVMAATGEPGNWIFVSGPNTPTISNDTDKNATISNLIQGLYIYEWNVGTAPCTELKDVVRINVYDTPSTADAGPDQSGGTAACQVLPQLDAVVPTTGIGTWTLTSDPSGGTGIVIDSPNDPKSTLTVNSPFTLPLGSYEFTWTVSNGNPVCSDSVDTVILEFNEPPATDANAGPDQELCDTDSTTLFGNTVSVGTGTWTQESGPNTAVIGNQFAAETPISGLIAGTYVFRWTIDSGGCSTTDTVQIEIYDDSSISVINAGPDQTVGQFDNILMSGTDVSPQVGEWIFKNGPSTPVIVDKNDPNTQITAVIPGTYEFTWNVAFGVCPPKEDTVIINVVGVTDISVNKSVNIQSPIVGSDVTYTILIENLGINNATGVVISDQLPVGISVVSGTVSNNGVLNPGNRTIVWSNLDINTASSIALTYQAKVHDPSGVANEYTNTAELTSLNEIDDNSSNNEDTVILTPISVVDVVLTKVVNNPSPNEGENIFFKITVKNNSLSSITNTVITDVLPAGLTYVNATATKPGWNYPNWDVGTMLPGEMEELILEVSVDQGTAGQSITNVITNNQDQQDKNLTLDDDNETIVVTNTNLVTKKTVQKQLVAEGETIWFTINVKNEGPGLATNVSLIDNLPSGLTYVVDVVSQGVYNNGSGEWNIGDIRNGDEASLRIFAKVNSGTQGQKITNITTAATGDQTDLITAGDDLKASVYVNSFTDIVVTKVADNLTPNVGDIVTYTITVTNAGNIDVTNLTLTDNLPSGLTHISGNTSVGTWTDPDWFVAVIQPGVTEVLTLQTLVGPGTEGQALTNYVTHQQDQFDLNQIADDLEETVNVTLSDLVTVKTVDNNLSNEGDSVIYTITVTNNGTSDATNVSLTDNLPNGITYVSDDAGGLYNNGSGIWNIGTIPSGGKAVLNISATVNVGTAGTKITNTTTAATGDQSDPGSIGDILSADLYISNGTDIVLRKLVNDNTPNEGDAILYEISVTNNGSINATNLVITDVLDPGLVHIGGVPSEGVWTYPNWNIGTLNPGVTENLLLQVYVANGTAGQTLVNTISNSQDQLDLNIITDDLTESVTVNSSDLITVKTVDNSTPGQGDTITYSISVTNNGPNDATRVSLIDQLPVGVTYLSDDSGGFYNSGSGIWFIGNLANGATENLNIVASVNTGTAGSTIINTTTIAVSDQTDPSTNGDILEAPIFVDNATDIVLSKTVDNSTPNEGDRISYTITVTNNGPIEATNVLIEDVIPTGLSYLSSFTTNGTYSNPNWTISSLPVGTTETLSLNVLVLGGTSGQSLTNTIINSQDQFDNNLTVDDNDETIRVTSVDLVTVKTVDNSNPAEGDTIVYTLSVTNNGPDQATNVMLVDNLPAGVTYVSDDSSGNYNTATGEWQVPSIKSGSNILLNITATVDAGTSDSFITNFTTAAQSDQSDNSTIGDILEATLHVDNQTDIVLTKTVDNSNPVENETIVYTISVSNNGPDEATSLKITDVLPTGLTEISATPSVGFWNNSVWNIGRLSSGASATLSLSASVDSGTAGMSLTNTISNTQDQLDSNITPDDDSETVIVASADLTTIKSVDNSTPNEGDTVSYTITVNNNGPNDATGVSLIDNLPNGVTYLSDNSGGTYNNGSGEWNLGNLSNGAVASLVIQATVNSGAAGTTITNNTTAAVGSQTDLTTNGDVLEAQIFVDNSTDIVLSKTANNANPNEGDEVIYTITVSNRGAISATNLVVTDLLPSGLTYVSGLPSTGLWISPSWSINTLPAGDSESLVVVAKVNNGTAGQTLTNTISNTQDQLDTNQTPDDLEETITVSSSDLRTVKTVNDSAPSVGDTIVYTITVSNNGLSDATGVSLIDNLPYGVTYVSDDSAGDFNQSSGIWNIGDLANQDVVSLNITASIDASSAGKTITNTTSAATADQADPNANGDQLDAVIFVDNKTDIVLSKVANSLTPNEGENVIFTIQVTNNSNITATNLIIQDILPAGLTYISGTPSKGIWNNPNWTINSLNPGVTSTLLLTVKVDSGTAGQSLTNTISNTQDQLDSNATADDSDETIVISSSDLVTVKSVDISTPNEGDTITYSITVTNNGKSNATGVSLIDKLPVGVTYVSDDAGGDYNSNTGLWNIGGLLNGTSRILHIQATVNANTSGKTITNTTSTALADQADPSSSGDILSAPIFINNETDIVLTKVANNLTPNEGDTVIYTVTVENKGPNTATNLEITDVLPVGLTYVSAIPTTGNWDGSLWSMPNLISGQTERIFITVTVDIGTSGQILRNTISNTQDQLDTNATLDDLEETIVVKAANLVTIKSVDNSTPTEGDTITYSITVSNNGPSDATNISLVDNLPNGVTYVSDNSGGAYNNGSGIWTLGNIANGASTSIQIQATVDPGTSGTTITNKTSSANGLESDPTTIGDILEAPIFVNNTTDIVLTKVVDNAIPNEGDEIYFTITVENKGPIDASNLIIEDILPSGLTYVSGVASEGIWTYPEWNLQRLDAGVAETLLLKVSVDSGTSGNSIINSIRNTQDQFDANITIDDDTEIINVTSSDLVTVKTVNNTIPSEGEVVVYSIAVTNNGPNNATNVSLEDHLPNGLTYINDDALGNYNFGSGIWNVGDIQSNSTVTLKIEAQVDFGTAGTTITNITTAATGDQTDPTNIGDILDASIYIENETDIVLTKTVNSNLPDEGDEIVYTITVTNNGPIRATNLSISDVLPTGLTYVSGVASFGIWSFPDWTISDLDIGATETLLVTALVDSGTAGQSLTNTISNSQDQLDTNTTLDDASETITVSSSDLVTVKSVDTTTPSEGDTISYTITVTNNGPNNATNVSLVDILPNGVTYQSDNSSGAYNSGSGIWTIGDVLNGGSASLIIEADVDLGTAGTTVTNSTTAASGDQADSTTAGDILDASIYIENETDIVLTKTVSTNLPDEGDEIVYTITVTNNGGVAATNLVIKDVLPAGLTYVQGVPTEGIWTAPQWNVGTLGVGVSETLLLRVKVELGTSGSSYTNTISNSQDQLDTNLTLDDLEETITVSSSDLVTVKSVDTTSPSEGDTISYTITVTNNGPNNATNVSLVDILPNGVTYQSDNSSGAYNSGSGIWTIGNMLNGDIASLTIEAQVDVGTAGTTVTNSTTAASGDQADSTTAGDVLDVTILIDNETDIVLSKTVSNRFPSEGEELMYTIIVTNNGPIETTNLVIEDVLPSGLTYVQGVPTEGIWTAPQWNVGSLGVGVSQTLLLRVLVDSGTAGQVLTNTISNTQDQLDTNVTLDDLEETITVSSSDLVTVKSVDTTTPSEGDTISYTITVTNNGPNNATNVSLVDILPNGVTYVSDNSSGAYNSGSGIWTIGDVLNGGSASLIIDALVDVGTAGTTVINSTTAASGDQTDPTNTGDILDASILIDNSTDIVLTKTVSNNLPDEGDEIVYTITVTNNGGVAATNLVIEDVLPAGLTYVQGVPTEGIWTAPQWNVGSLGVGVSQTLLLRVLVDSGTAGQVLTNTISNTQDQLDTNVTLDDLEETITVSSSDLVTVKSVDNTTPSEGDTISYTITVTNNGPNNATNVSLVDILPNGVTYVSDNSSGAYNSGSGIWTIGDVLNGGSASLIIDAQVDIGTAGTTVTNSTTAASGDQADSTTAGDVLDASIYIENETDIVLTKTVSNNLPDEGDEIEYTITVTNNGGVAATNLVIEDVLPSGLTYVQGVPTEGIWTAPQWNVGTLGVGVTETLLLTVSVDSGTAGQVLTNTISNTQDQLDTNVTLDDLEETITVSSSDLVTVKSVDNTTPSEGDTISYTITVTNNGPNNATNVSLVDNLPNGVTYVSDNSSGTYNSGSGIWTIGDVLNGGSASLIIDALVDVGTAGTTVINSTTAASGDQADSTTAGDVLDASILIDNSTDIVLTKTVSNNLPDEGDEIVYTITVTNNGGVAATNLVIEDVLPSGLTYVQGVPTEGIWTAPQWNVGTLGVGVTETLLLTVSVDSGTAGQVLTNTISNTQDQLDTNVTLDDLEETITVSSSDLVTVKSVDTTTPSEGDTISYTITVTNNGPNNATNVSLVDILPNGVTYQSDNSSGSYNSGSGIWTIGDVLNGGSASLIIEALVDVGTAGTTVTNSTTAASGDQADSTTAGDVLDVSIYIENETDIVLTKTVSNNLPDEGDEIVYTITVTNNGPVRGTNVSISDVLPTGLTYVSGVASFGVWSFPDWTISNLDIGATHTLLLTAMVDSGTAGQVLTNTISNTQDQLDTNVTLDDLEETITVSSSDLVTVKSLDNTTPSEGDIISYTITVTNNGPNNATNVSLVDILPNGVTYVSDNSSGAYNSGSGIWTVGDVLNGGSASLIIDAQVDVGTAGTTVTNSTTAASGDQADSTTAGDVLDASIYIENETDIVLTKTVSNNLPDEGDEIVYTITVTNNGGVAATNLVIEDVLPSGLTYVQGVPTEGIWTAPQWNVGTLGVGVTETLLLTVSVDSGTAGQVLTNTISNTQDQLDTNLTLDDLEETIRVSSSDLVTVKSVDNTTPSEGDTISYTITVTNNGPNKATNVSLVDILPNGVTYVSDNSSGAYNSGSGIWTIGDVLNGGSASLIIDALVDVGTAGTTVINSTTAASGDQADSSTAGDVLDASILIDNSTDIVLTKTVSNNLPDEGDEIVYTITVTNNGGVAATNLVIEDVLPSGLTYVQGAPTEGIWTAPQWNVGSLGVGVTETLLLTVSVDSGTAGQVLINTISNSQDQLDTNVTLDDLEETITVSSSDLVTVKSVDNTTPSEGDTISYTITVTNNGPNNATNVSLVDILPNGVTYQSDNSSGAYNSGSGIWTIGDVLNGGSASLIIDAQVDIGTAGTTVINSTTAASGDQADSTTAGDVLDASIYIDNSTDIVLTKTVSNNLPDEGDEIVYTITVTNNGGVAATNLVIEDVLPSGLTYVQGVPTEGIWTAPQWNVGSLGVGVSQTLLLRVLVDSGTAGQVLTNTISNTQDQLDTNVTLDDLEETITVSSSDLVTVKSVDTTTPSEGDTISYTITVTNNGPNNATNVSLVDILPNGVTYQSDNSSGAYNSGSGIWTIGDVLNGGSASLIIDAQVDIGTAGTTVTNSTTAASGDQADSTTAGDVLDASIYIDNSTDIVLTKTVSNNLPDEGDEIVYTITVTNNGGVAATNLVIEDVLPSELTYVQGVPTEGIWTAPQWNVGSLGVGVTETLLLTVSVDSGTAGQVLTNTISNSQDQLDTNLTLDDLEETITVSSSDLVTVKSVDNTTPSEGDTISYTITVTNNGPNNAINVSLVDILPNGVTYQSDNSSGSYNSGSGIWTIGDMLNGDIASLIIEAQVDVGTAGTTVTNSTTAASGDQTDSTTAGDVLDASILIDNSTDIVLTKTVSNNLPDEGDEIVYTITVTNNGGVAATNLVIEDVLPSGLTYVQGVPTEGIWTAPQWNVGSLGVGVTETLLLRVLVDSGTAGQVLINTISNTQDQLDTNTTLDDASETITVSSSDLVTVKSVDTASPSEGDTISYTITVTNNGPNNATNVSLVDILPNGVTYQSDNSSGSYNSGSGIWTIGDMLNGDIASLIIEAQVDIGTAGTTVTNSTTAASGDQIDPTNAGDILDASILIDNSADIVLTKTVSNNLPDEGDEIVYTITVTNNGAIAATNLVIEDILPSGLTYVQGVPTEGIWTAPQWNVGSLGVGVTENLLLTVLVDSGTAAQVLTNTINNSQDQLDSNITLDDASETITVSSSDLSVVKTVDNVSPLELSTISYSITVSNNGPNTATNVSLVDNLPNGVTYLSDNSAGAYNSGSGIWTLGDIADGAVKTLIIEASVNLGTSGQTITNTTSNLTLDQADIDSSNNIGSVDIVPIRDVDLSLIKSFVDNNGAPNYGNIKTFEIIVSNSGSSIATGVEVTDILPSGYNFISYSSTTGVYDEISGIWNVGTVVPGNDLVLLIEVEVLGTGDYENCAEISKMNETDTDSIPGNGDSNEDDYSCASISFGDDLDLGVEKTIVGNLLSPSVGDQIIFNIELTNYGLLDVLQVEVEDILPDGYTFISYQATSGTYNISNGIWSLSNVVKQTSEVLTIVATVNAFGNYENCTRILSSSINDKDPSNDQSCITPTPTDLIDLELTKTVSNANPNALDDIEFTIELSNKGLSTATGVEVLDIIPNGYNFISFTSTTGDYDETNGVWELGTPLDSGDSESLLITVNVLPTGVWKNTAQVQFANETDIDSTPGNNNPNEDDQDSVEVNVNIKAFAPEEFTPNGDGINDTFVIQNLHVLYPNFRMVIVNRWGSQVYEYQHNGNPNQEPEWWDGFSQGKMNIGNTVLPDGTYFYSIEFKEGNRKPVTGWVYLRK